MDTKIESKKWELNFLGEAWQFEGETEEQAEKEYLRRLGFSIKSKYEKYCQSIGITPRLRWTEVK